MIARGFKSVIWVATVGGAALSCYMVSLRVATERNELAKVERQIVAAKRDIRSLQTELGTRGRMTQLEQWNTEVLALSAPSSAQFLKDEFTLARLYRNDPTVAERSAEVRLASAQTGAATPAESAKPATPPVVRAVAETAPPQPPMVHTASFTTGEASARPKPAIAAPERVRAVVAAAKADKPAEQRIASVPPKAQTDRRPSKATAKSDKPAETRTASAPTVKPGAVSTGQAEKPATKPESRRTAAVVRPVREAAAAPRSKGKGGGGN
ncbi:MAG TPA: hypothetical protein VF535_16870 [Allosphingosinicella sp.]